MKHNKVVLIGNGQVGSSYVFSLLHTGVASEIVIIDLDHQKAHGDALDLNHSVYHLDTPTHVRAGTYEDCNDAELVVICAGANQKPGETRLDLVKTNMNIFKMITDSVVESGFQGIFIVATNPVDILSHAVQKFSGFDPSRVIGSGTTLDTARFKYLLGQEFNVSPHSVDAWIIGEHGDSELAVWSQTSIAGQQLNSILEQDQTRANKVEDIFVNTRDAAYEIIQSKGATYYGVATALTRITRAILNNENRIMPVSSLLSGEYNSENVYIGVPTVINRQGALRVIEIPLDEREQEQFNHSVQVLKDIQAPFDIFK